MHKLLLATVLLTAFSMPAVADYPKADNTISELHAGDMRDGNGTRQVLPRRSERGEVEDPYWTPCDYSTSWGPDSCE